MLKLITLIICQEDRRSPEKPLIDVAAAIKKVAELNMRYTTPVATPRQPPTPRQISPSPADELEIHFLIIPIQLPLRHHKRDCA
jgi:hypothetical protein